MNQMSASLSTLEYPGRLILLGTSPGGDKAVVVYAITGRSPSSQARRLVSRDHGIWVEPTDEAVLKKGNVDLLVYPALLVRAGGLAVSNGKQTGDILDRLSQRQNPAAVLAEALEEWDYEPDSPIFTPRISGCVKDGRAGLSVIRRGPGGLTLRNYFEVPGGAGHAALISTYQGPNLDPLPTFEGEPRAVVLSGTSPRETAEAVYEALAPGEAAKDFRVAVSCVFAPWENPAECSSHIVNRHARI